MNTIKTVEPAKRVVIKKEGNIATESVVFSCAEHNLSRVIKLRDLTPEIVTQLALHGLSQKVGDAAAIDASLKPTIQDKWSAMMEVADRLEAGQWNKEGRETGAKEYNDTLAALVEWKGCQGDELRTAKLTEWASKQSKEALYALRDSKPDLLAIYVRIKGRKATTLVDSAILDDLEAI